MRLRNLSGGQVRTIQVPGHWSDEHGAFLNLLARKVPCEYYLQSGERLLVRRSAFLAGVAHDRHIYITERTNGEQEFLDLLGDIITPAEKVSYRGSHHFDERVLMGTFTMGPRKPAERPFFPAMPGAHSVKWTQERFIPVPIDQWRSMRTMEVPISKAVEVFDKNPGIVITHVLRNLVEMIGTYGRPDERCAEWCARVLTDLDFATSEALLRSKR
jgi:hypothetical protein